jgi:hypothetical protein
VHAITFKLKYTGDTADRHLLPAHEGARSIEAMSWALSLVGHYVATGNIQKRGNLDRNLQFYLRPPQRGSFAAEIIAELTKPENIWLTTIFGTYAVATATDSINFVLRHVFLRACGLYQGESQVDSRKLAKLPSGDVEALVDAVEPSVSRAHGIIGEGASSLILQKARTPIIEMDAATKEYVRTSLIDDAVAIEDLSVGALNVNSGNGRVYFESIGKTAPFSVVREPLPGTYEALSQSLTNYARGIQSRVPVAYRAVMAVDGRVKKLIVIGAGPSVKSSKLG